VQPGESISLKGLREERYGQVLCYPKYDLKEMKKRLKELKKLGVKAVEFAGEKMAFDVPVLGKGCVGIVVAAQTDAGKVALKIRRVDADRAGMQHEAEMLRRANAVDVGPRLINVTENFLLMEFVEGTLLPRWVEALRGRGTRSRIRRVLRAVLEQCYVLDEAGLDHGELSRAPKHIIVDPYDHPHLVDFETASVNRRVSNVTSICQYLFIGSQVAKKIKRKLGGIDEKKLINALRNYKQERTKENFEKILGVCGLDKVNRCSGF
jgi:putative serine/threonine protein kinase